MLFIALDNGCPPFDVHAAVIAAFDRARAAALEQTRIDARTSRARLEARLEAFQRRLPPNAHRLGQLVRTGPEETSVIRDANVVESNGKPWAYVYRTTDATFLIQRDLASRGTLARITDPERQFPTGSIVMPMRDATGRPIAASHRFLPLYPTSPPVPPSDCIAPAPSP